LLESASNSIRREGVRRAMQALPDIERRILELRFGFEGEPWTLRELVEEFDLSRERIRQLEGQALCRLGVLRDLVGCYHAQISRRVKASEGA
jgi:RNA polymerase primary sigma factor